MELIPFRLMKILHHLLLSILSTSPFLWVNAKPLTVFFGTSGRGSEGIYQATFNPDNGKFTPAKLAAKIGSPGFLALHPNGKILYSVGRWEDGSGALGYHISKNGELEEFTRMICPDGGSAHIAVHPSGKFLLTAQYGGGSVALFPLDSSGKLGEPTVTEHQGGSKVVDRRQDSPTRTGPDFLPTATMPDPRSRSRPDRNLQSPFIQACYYPSWSGSVRSRRRSPSHAIFQ